MLSRVVRNRSRRRRARRLPALVAALSLVTFGAGPAAADTAAPACPTEDLPPTGFTDVRGIHTDGIRCLVWYGLANGRTDRHFAPARAVTRGQLASLLARTLEVAGTALPEPDSRLFADTADAVHGDRLEQLARVGIVRGTVAATSDPERRVTRGQLASLLARALEEIEGRAPARGPDAFVDDDGTTHEAAIDAVAAAGLVRGTGGGAYGPGDSLTRAQAATVLARLLDRFVAADRLEPPPTPAMQWETSRLPDAVRREMTGVSWRPGCPVGLDELRLVVLTHHGMDGRLHRGELVVHHRAVREVRTVFARLYEAGFPLERVERVERYGGDDDRSMAANNTSAFNCRRVTGGSGWSEHSYGTSIDLNPVQNPYVRGSTVLPAAGRDYTERSRGGPGMVVEGGVVVRAFDDVGWGWGGRWNTLKDYQHFSRSGR